MLVPEIAGGASKGLAELLRICDSAVASLLVLNPERVIVIGSGDLPGDVDESAGGTFAGYGVDVRTGGGTDELPLSLTMGAWLLDRAGWSGPRVYSTGQPDTTGQVALLVMADGSAKRTSAAPGYFDARAEGFDAAISRALAEGDAGALMALDAELGDELWAAGTRVLTTMGHMTKDANVTPHVRYDAAPFGVGYWVAEWMFG